MAVPRPTRSVACMLVLLLGGGLPGCVEPDRLLPIPGTFRVPEHRAGDHAVLALPHLDLVAEVRYRGAGAALDAWFRSLPSVVVDARDITPRLAEDDDGRRVVHLAQGRTSVLQVNGTSSEGAGEWTGVTSYPGRSMATLQSLLPFLTWPLGDTELRHGQAHHGELNGLAFVARYEGRDGPYQRLRVEFPFQRTLEPGGDSAPHPWAYELIFDDASAFPKEIRFQSRAGPLILDRKSHGAGSEPLPSAPAAVWPGSAPVAPWTLAPPDQGSGLFFPLDHAMATITATPEYRGFKAAHDDVYAHFLRYIPQHDAVTRRALWEASFAAPGSPDTLRAMVERTQTGPLPAQTVVHEVVRGSAGTAPPRAVFPDGLLPLAQALVEARSRLEATREPVVEFSLSSTGPPYWYQGASSLRPEVATWKLVGSHAAGEAAYQVTVILSALTGEALSEKRQRLPGP